MDSINIAPIMQVCVAFAGAAITASTPYAVYLIEKFWAKAAHIELTAQQKDAVTGACQQGANLAYEFLVSEGSAISNIPIKNSALATGVNHVLSSVPDAIKAMGINQDQIERMVKARLGGLLAQDAGVTVAEDAPAATPAASPAAAPAPTIVMAPAPSPTLKVETA